MRRTCPASALVGLEVPLLLVVIPGEERHEHLSTLVALVDQARAVIVGCFLASSTGTGAGPEPYLM